MKTMPFISKLLPDPSRRVVLMVLGWTVVEQTLLNEKPCITFPARVSFGLRR